MAMGRKARQRRQEAIWIAQTDLPRTVAHPFYEQLNRLLEERSFDEWVEQQCTRFYAERMGRPSLAPGRYFRLLLIGYFEGIDSERGIAWRAADWLAQESGIATPTREQLAKLDRKRAHKGSNEDWVNPHDPEAGITKLKDGRTHLAYKAEHAVDLETGVVVAVTVATGDAGDTATILGTLPQAGEHIAEVACTTNNEEVGERVHPQGPVEAVADKGYHSNDTLQALGEAVVRTYISEPDRGQRHWQNKPEARQAVYDNRRRIRGEHGKQLLRRRGELVERSFAHAYETGGMRRVHLRGRDNVLKRMLIHVGGFNLSLVMRKLLGKGTPRGLQGLSAENLLLLLRFWVAVLAGAAEESASTPMFMSSHALPSRFLLCSRQNERISSATGC